MTMTALKIPVPLQTGDTVAIIAPAGGLVDSDRFRHGCSVLSEMGFELAVPDRLWPGSGILPIPMRLAPMK